MKKITNLFLSSVLRAPPVSVGAFQGLLRTLLELDRGIPEPDPDLESAQGGTITGYLFAEGPIIVDTAARALEEDRDIFAAYPDPRPLREHQDRAYGWQRLHQILQELADRAAAQHRLEQVAATRRALDILRQARDAARAPFATREDRARAGLLELPEALLRAWQRRKGGR